MKKKLVFLLILIILCLNSVLAEDNMTDVSKLYADDLVLDTFDVYSIQGQYFEAILKTQNGTPVSNETILFSVDSIEYNKTTDSQGVAKLKINLNPGTYAISTNYGNLMNNNIINVRDSSTIFVSENLTNPEIQSIIDSAESGSTLEFLGNSYNNIALTINDKLLNLVSYGGTKLYGVNDKSIILLTGNGVLGAKISGLNLIGGLNGISVTNLANYVTIFNNSISNCKNGIVFDNVRDNIIENNKILNIENNAIALKNSESVNIVNNTISKNVNGIYYDMGNRFINIINNTIAQSSNYGINFDKSGEYTNVRGNTIMENQNGISVNCNAAGLVIEYNKISDNEENGINFGETYRKTSDGKDALVNGNVVADNKHMNILGRDSIYTNIDIGGNWVGSDDRVFSSVCFKIKMPFYSLDLQQTGSGSFQISIGQNGVANPLLPSYTAVMSFDGGKTWQAVTITDGKANVYVSEGDGTVLIRTDGPTQSLTLKDYVPYVPDTETTEPITNGTQEEDSNTGATEPITNGTQEDGSNSGSNANGNPSLDVGNSNNDLVAAATSAASQQSESDSVISDNGETSESATSESSQSQSVAKSINVDEEMVRVVGEGAIILLIILIICSYYRKDIESMINNKKGN